MKTSQRVALLVIVIVIVMIVYHHYNYHRHHHDTARNMIIAVTSSNMHLKYQQHSNHHHHHHHHQKQQQHQDDDVRRDLSSTTSSVISDNSNGNDNVNGNAKNKIIVVTSSDDVRRDLSSSTSGGVKSDNDNDNAAYDDNDDESWASRFGHKLRCLSHKYGSIYLYHMRKCAGTSIAEILNFASSRYVGHMIHSTEGKTIDTSSPSSSSILDQSGLMTVISLREPVDRIVSLYWYEHASFHYMRNREIASLSSWFLVWSDGSAWKQAFVDKNPGNVYVEVENYYVKVLSGWQGNEAINEATLEIAKATLRKFDIVLIKEWMTSIAQVLLIIGTITLIH